MQQLYQLAGVYSVSDLVPGSSALRYGASGLAHTEIATALNDVGPGAGVPSAPATPAICGTTSELM